MSSNDGKKMQSENKKASRSLFLPVQQKNPARCLFVVKNRRAHHRAIGSASILDEKTKS
jgi:hypothetical protein